MIRSSSIGIVIIHLVVVVEAAHSTAGQKTGDVR